MLRVAIIGVYEESLDGAEAIGPAPEIILQKRLYKTDIATLKTDPKNNPVPELGVFSQPVRRTDKIPLEHIPLQFFQLNKQGSGFYNYGNESRCDNPPMSC